MQAVILAGGQGTALRPINANIPKPLVPLFDRPVIEHTVSLLREHDITDIIIALSDQALDIAEYLGDGSALGVKIRYSVEDEPLGSAGAIKQVQGMLKGRFIVIPGDVVTDFDLRSAIDAHLSSPAIATLLVSEADDPTEFGVLEFDASRRVTRYVEKPWSDAVFSDIVSTGICIMEPDALGSIPPFEHCDFASVLLPRLINNGEPVYGIRPAGYWCDIGNVNHYRRVHFDALEGNLRLDLHANQIVDGVWIGDRVEIHSSANIAGPVFFGDGAVVRQGASVGSYSVIGPGALIDDGAQIDHSVIGGGSIVGRETVVTNCIIGGGYELEEGKSLSDAMLIENAAYLPATAPKTNTRVQPTRSAPVAHLPSTARVRAF